MIPFIDLKAQFEVMEVEIRASIDRVLNHGNFIMGPEVAELERELAAYARVKHAVSCSSGTDALLMPLMAWNIGAGDAVFTTAYSFVATAEVISLVGATPVFVDIDPTTFNIDPEKLADAITRTRRETSLRPRCIIPVDLFGLPADHDAIASIAKDHGLRVLDDAAQAFGAEYRGRRLGACGDACAVSFFPAKPLGCYGDGGAVLTNSDELANLIRSIRVHGKGSHKYDNVRVGLNARLDTIQAAILLVKLKYLAAEIERRRQVASEYSRLLESFVTVPRVEKSVASAWAQYSILSDDREALGQHLKEAGIPSAVYYQTPLPLLKVYASLGYRPGQFPVAERTSRRILCLPMHAYLGPDELNRIGLAVAGWSKSGRPSAVG